MGEHFLLSDALVGFRDPNGRQFVHVIEDDDLNAMVCAFLKRKGRLSPASGRRVVDHEPGGWFLVQDGARLLLDVNCNHSAASYEFLMELNADEREDYTVHRHQCLSDLAEKVQYSAPGVLGSDSPYRGRVLRGADRERVNETTIAWLKDRGGA